VVDFINRWSDKTGIALSTLVLWLGVSLSKFYAWRGRYGKANEHNAQVPRDHWLEDWEKQAIVAYERQHPLEGYRRLTFMMLDDDVVAVSPPTVYRVLKAAGQIGRGRQPNPRKGKGFHQPSRPHRQWHIDFSYLNICGTFYYLCSILDGYSRYLVHWEIRERMTQEEAQIIVQRAREKFPGENPRIISDNGPQFIAKDFKDFLRHVGMTHTLISPGYPQSNGKKERWYETLKSECLRPNTPLSLEDAQRLVALFVEHYNHVRLHSAIGYVTPADKLFGLENVIHQERDRKLEAAREQRRQRRQATRQPQEPPRRPAAETKPPGPTANLPAAWVDFRNLRQTVTLEQVLKQLGYFDALRGHGPQRRGPCPLHDQPEASLRSFSVNLAKNVFQCFHPACRAAGNALDLWAAVHRLPPAEAARHLAQTLNLPLTPNPTAEPEKRNPYPKPSHPLTPNAPLSTSR
jgi:transposase InsO family protein